VVNYSGSLWPWLGWAFYFRPSDSPELLKAQLALLPVFSILTVAMQMEIGTPRSLRPVLRSRARLAVQSFGVVWLAGSASILLFFPYTSFTIGDALIVRGEVVEAPLWQVYGWTMLYDSVTIALGPPALLSLGLVVPPLVGVLFRRASLVVAWRLPPRLGSFCSQLVRSGILDDRVTGIAPAHDELWDHLLTTWPTRWVAPRDVVERVGDEE
jgi:hypothetical protein